MKPRSDIDKTKEAYGFLWTKDGIKAPLSEYHFNKMQEVIPEKIVRGKWGIDVGSGCGYDTHIMAKNNPSVNVVSMDISEGVRTTLEINRNLPNVYVVKGSVLNMPFKEGIFDFAYSFGVMHHVPFPQKGLSEIVRVLKKKSPVFLYLYESHSQNPAKYIAIKITNLARWFTIRMPHKILFILSTLVSPFIFLFFSFPSRVLSRFRFTKKFAEKIPFNFGTSFFSLRWDLYDRLGAPVEHRFGREEVYNMLDNNNLLKTGITRLRATAGWVAWGYKESG